MISSNQKRVFRLLHLAGVKDRAQRLRLLSWMACREVSSSNDLSEVELKMCAEILEKWKADGVLADQALIRGG
jgi:hypothetical protein